MSPLPTPDEINQLFRTIKAIADFPKVTYVLAFDKTIVAKALGSIHLLSGEEYLEKIIQVPFELPLPTKGAMRQLFLSSLEKILVETPEELLNLNYLSNVYHRGIEPFIQTPRDIVRFINTFSVTYNSIKGEVNSVDFLAIEILRVFIPEIYQLVRQNPEYFAGTTTYGFYYQNEEKRLRQFHKSWMESIDTKNRQLASNLLKEIFPKVKYIESSMGYGESYLPIWRKERKICSPDVFDIYFHLSISPYDISNAEMSLLVAIVTDEDIFSKKLIELSSQQKIRTFLERLDENIPENINKQQITSILLSLFDTGEILLAQDEMKGVFDISNVRILLLRLTNHLLRRLEMSERLTVIKYVVEQGTSISLSIYIANVFSDEHKKSESDGIREATLTIEDAQILEEAAIDKMLKLSRDNPSFLISTPFLPQVLHYWMSKRGQHEVSSWVSKVINSEHSLLVFMKSFLSKRFSQSVEDVGSKVTYRLTPKMIEPFVEVDEIASRLRNIYLLRKLEDNQQLAIKTFLDAYDLVQQGKNPDDIW